MNLQPRESPERPIDPQTRIGHVHLKAANLDDIEAFYVGVLGFEVINRMPTALFLSAGGYHHHLAFNTWHSAGGSPAPAASTGLYHVAINYPTREALADALARLVSAGHPLQGASDHGTHEAIYLTDVEGNGLELAWDRPEDQWPLDSEGHLRPVIAPLDLQALLDLAA
jgi:catechol 2,3-dioxygenase